MLMQRIFVPQIGGTPGLMPQVDGTCLTCNGNGHLSRDVSAPGVVRSAGQRRDHLGTPDRASCLTSIMFYYPR